MWVAANVGGFNGVDFSVPVLTSYSASPALHHIVHVVLMRAEQKMVRVATRRVVAYVANEYAARYWPVDKLISYAVRHLFGAA
jgi:hypothetical protein